MDYDGEEGFPGLYHGDAGKRSNESDYSDGDHEKPSKKDLLIGRRKDKKESKKDRGYAALAGESSPEEDADTRSPSKMKKPKTFKFPSKSKEKREKSRDKEKGTEREGKDKDREGHSHAPDKDKKKEKEGHTHAVEKDKKKDKEGADKKKEKENSESDKKKEKLRKEKEKREKEKEEKMKMKESKEKVKEKDKEKKDKKGSKQQVTVAAGVPFEEIFTLGVARPIFGVSLSLSVERYRCHDNSNLPLVVRDCIDYLQEHGLQSELLYRSEPPRVRLLALRQQYNDRCPVPPSCYSVPLACGLLKLFISELPEPLLTTELCVLFEQVVETAPSCSSSSVCPSLEALVSRLPTVHRALLAWLLSHFNSALAYEKSNGLNVQSVCSLLCGTLHMSPALLTALLASAHALHLAVTLTRYVPPLSPGMSRLPSAPADIAEELRKQESLLSQLHAEMHAGFVTPQREDQLWEGQRIVTQLKRMLRTVQKSVDVASCPQAQTSEEKRAGPEEESPPPSATSTTPEAPAASATQAETSNSNSEPATVTPTPTTEAAKAFEDNFENFEEDPSESSSNAPQESKEIEKECVAQQEQRSSNQEQRLSDKELILMQLQLERAEYLQLESILRAKINQERFEIVKLKSRLSLKLKQEVGREAVQVEEEEVDEEMRARLVRENAVLEQRRLALVQHIYQQRAACINMRVQLAIKEIM